MLTKRDLVDAKMIEAEKKKLQKYNKDIIVVSIYDEDSIEKLQSSITNVTL